MSFNISSSPHVRCGESTRSIMYDVCLALLPATAFGVYRFGLYSLLVLIISVGCAVLAEYVYQKITGQKVLISDGSAILTGLLLGLNMPPRIPLWAPALGSIFAVIVVKQFFGGLGHNFMNPALGGRIFLLISFTGLMSDFSLDGVSSATPLAEMLQGAKPDIAAMFVGNTLGTIGEVSAVALLIGGIYLLIKKVITWEIPVCYLGSFTIFLILFGGKGFNLTHILAHLCGGGIMLGAWFMATDYVTSPITKNGKILFGIILGVLTGVFRVFGVAPEGVSYAIVIGNLLVPLIEKVTMPKAFGLENVKKEKKAKEAKAADASDNKEETATADAKSEEKPAEKKASIPMSVYRAAMNLCAITLVAGLLLGVVYQVTKEPIHQAEVAAETAAFKAVCPEAASFEEAADILANAPSIEGTLGDVVVDKAFTAIDASGNVCGYAVNVTSKEGFGGEITLSVGFDTECKVTGIEFLAITETAGLGMNATEESFRSQYVGKEVDEFSVTKTGASSDNEIEAISGATITSKAVTSAVNTALACVKSVAK